MQQKAFNAQNKGMMRDLSISKFQNEYAFENFNIRIEARDNETMYSVTNERGQKYNQNIAGIVLGSAYISDCQILFCKDGTTDYIYKCQIIDDNLKVKTLFRGSLNFPTSGIIETTVRYESDKVQKVYWVDGVNSTRVINIADETLRENNEFDFVPECINTPPLVEISKSFTGDGGFSAGTVQYFFTYYNKNLQETRIFYSTDLCYNTHQDRGASPDETVSVQYTLTLKRLNTDFDYIRIYSYVKSSSGVGSAYLVGDYPISEDKIVVTDNGTHNTTIDPSLLLYIGGQDFIAETITSKDGKLFLGNIKYKEANNADALSSAIKRYCFKSDWEAKDDVILFEKTQRDAELNTGKKEGQYYYDFQLNNTSSEILSFKGGEKYRFAVQFTDKRGYTTRAYWIGDKENTLYPGTWEDNGSIKMSRIVAVCNLPSEVKEIATKLGYVAVTLLIAKATGIADRSVIAQGVVNPTVFNLYDRTKKLNYARASWISRPMNGNIPNKLFEPLASSETVLGEIQNAYWGEDTPKPYYSENEVTTDITTEGAYVRYGMKITKNRDSSTSIKVFYCRCLGYDSDGNPILEPHISSSNVVGSRGMTDTDIQRMKESYLNADYLIYSDSGKRKNVYNRLLKFFKNTLELTDTDCIPKSDLDSIMNSLSKKESAYYPTEFRPGEYTNWADANFRQWDESTTIKIDVGPQTATEATVLNRDRRYYFVDTNTVTLNSPELEDNQIDLTASNIKFRIVGVASLGAVTTSYDLNFTNAAKAGTAIIEENLSNSIGDVDHFGWNGFTSYPIYNDGKAIPEADTDETSPNYYITSNVVSTDDDYYAAYIFNKEGSLIGATDASGNNYGELKNKIIANRRFCAETLYVKDKTKVWSPEYGLSVAKIYNDVSKETLVLDTKNESYYEGSVNTINLCTDAAGKVLSYPLFGTLTYPIRSNDNNDTYTALWGSSDPVKIKYSTTTHAVLSFKNSNEEIVALPWLINCSDTFTSSQYIAGNDSINLPWLNESYKKYYVNPYSYNIDIPNATWNQDTAYVFIGELYKQYPSGNGDTRYGGISEAAVNNNEFIPASASTPINSTIVGNRGDTYIQRYDCLKTRPDNEEEKQQLVEIVSAIIETHINLDGRYDTKRYWTNLLGIDYSNFAPINKGYTAFEDLIINSTLDSKFNDGNYSNQAVHSLVANTMEDVDTWTNITLAATVDFDGKCGKLNRIISYNNNIYAFQDKGISLIPYNERTQINNTNGLPIEIANSMTVGTPQYLTKEIGCLNKASIVGTSSGIYFVDDYNKNIVHIEGQEIKPLSIVKGFNVWTQKNCNSNKWTAYNATGFHSYYDSIYGDIYFYFNDSENSSLDTLCYNERLGEFTSFFSYGNVEDLFSLKGRVYSIKEGKIYENHKGDYGIIYGEKQEYYSIYNVTPDPFSDKIYSTVEYRANMYLKDVATQSLPFDTIEVWNDYQRGKAKVKLNPINVYPDAKRKFRIWRTDVPRDTLESKYGLNRIRSPWVKIKLSKDVEEIQKQRMELHDMTVTYFE